MDAIEAARGLLWAAADADDQSAADALVAQARLALDAPHFNCAIATAAELALRDKLIASIASIAGYFAE